MRRSIDPNTLVVAVDAFDADFDPASAYLLSEALIWRGIYEAVRLKGDSASEVEPLLADTWDPNADSSSWTFHLHPGVTFSDGTPLDAEAVKANTSGRSGSSSGPSSSSARSCRSRRSRSWSRIRRRSGSTSRPLPALRRRDGRAVRHRPGQPEGLPGPLDGRDRSGARVPAVPRGRDRPVRARHARARQPDHPDPNQDYWRGWDGPHFDTIIIRSIPEGSTRRQLLESGDVDIAYAGTAEDTAAVRSDGRSGSAISRTST